MQGTCARPWRYKGASGQARKQKSFCSGRLAWSGTNLANLLQEAGRKVSAEVKAQKELRVTKSTKEYRDVPLG